MFLRIAAIAAVGATTLVATPAVTAQTFYGPTVYLERGDSPLIPLGVNLYVEDFEDGAFNAPGVSAGPTVQLIPPGGLTDSVDQDDGVIDGFGTDGWSLFDANGPNGITFTFDPAVLGRLPHHAGVTWTDGGNSIWFEAFGENGQSLGTIGPENHADGSFFGTTGEDRFYGVSYPNGISSLRIWNTSGGIEVDHLQYEFNGLGLETSDASVTTGDPLTLSTSGGVPGKLVILVVLDVNGVTLFQHVATSLFTAQGTWDLAATVPPGLNGLDVGMITIGAAAWNGKLDLSNRVEIEFQ